MVSVDVIIMNAALTRTSIMKRATADALIKLALKTTSSTMNNANATVWSLPEQQHAVMMNSGRLSLANVCVILTQNVALLMNSGPPICADVLAAHPLPAKMNTTLGTSSLANAAAAHQAFAVLNNTSTP